MRVGYEDEAAVCRLTLGRQYQGWDKIAHGGIVSTVLDEIMAYAVINYVGQGLTTRMETTYRKAVPLGVPLKAVGRVTGQRSRMATAEGPHLPGRGRHPLGRGHGPLDNQAGAGRQAPGRGGLAGRPAVKHLLLTVGKPKAAYLAQGIDDYLARLKPYGGGSLAGVRPAKLGPKTPDDLGQGRGRPSACWPAWTSVTWCGPWR